MSETKAKSVAMQLTDALLTCKNVLMQHVGLPTANQEVCKTELITNDPELQCFGTDANELIIKLEEDGSLSLDVLDNVITSMSCLGQKTADAILDFKKKMINMKDDGYKLVVKEYLSSSLELLDFFTELEKFLDSARRSHSHIEHAIEECSSLGSKHGGVGREEAKMISNILINVMASNVNDHSGEKLIEKARCLLEKQETMFSKCVIEKEKLGKDQKSIHGWNKLLNYIFIGIKFLVIVVLTVMLAKYVQGDSSAIVSELKIQAACMVNVSSIIVKVDHWTSSSLEVCQKEFLMKTDAVNTIQEGALHSIKEMGEIKDLIAKVVNSIESLLALSTNVANGGNVQVAIKNIKCYLKKLLGKIKVLEEKTAECSSRISKARQAVLM